MGRIISKNVFTQIIPKQVTRIKVKKYSKIEQDQKTFIPAFTCSFGQPPPKFCLRLGDWVQGSVFT